MNDDGLSPAFEGLTSANPLYLPYSRRPMRRLAAALLLCVLVFGVAIDSIDATCLDSTPAHPCQACICQTPVLHSTLSHVVIVPSSSQCVPPQETMVKQRLPDEELFRPPKPLS